MHVDPFLLCRAPHASLTLSPPFSKAYLICVALAENTAAVSILSILAVSIHSSQDEQPRLWSWCAFTGKLAPIMSRHPASALVSASENGSSNSIYC